MSESADKDMSETTASVSGDVLTWKEETCGKGDFRIFVFDLETTSLSVVSERIVEIAIVDLETGSNYTSFVNPGRVRMHPKAEEMTGLTTELVQHPEVRPFAEVAPEVLAFIRKWAGSATPVLVAHYGQGFDIPFLVNELARVRLSLPDDWLCLDSHQLCLDGNIVQKMGVWNLKLATLRQHFGFEGDQHRALVDAQDLAAMLPALVHAAYDKANLHEMLRADLLGTFPAATITPHHEVLRELRDEVVQDGWLCLTMHGLLSCWGAKRVHITSASWPQGSSSGWDQQCGVVVEPQDLNTVGLVRLVLLLRSMRIKAGVASSGSPYQETQPTWNVMLEPHYRHDKGTFESVAEVLDALVAKAFPEHGMGIDADDIDAGEPMSPGQQAAGTPQPAVGSNQACGSGAAGGPVTRAAARALSQSPVALTAKGFPERARGIDADGVGAHQPVSPGQQAAAKSRAAVGRAMEGPVTRAAARTLSQSPIPTSPGFRSAEHAADSPATGSGVRGRGAAASRGRGHGRGRGSPRGRGRARGRKAPTPASCLHHGLLWVSLGAQVGRVSDNGCSWELNTIITESGSRVTVPLLVWPGFGSPGLEEVKGDNVTLLDAQLPVGRGCDVVVVVERLWQSPAGRGVKLVAHSIHFH